MGYFRPISIDIEPLTPVAQYWLEKTKKENFLGDKSFRLLLTIKDHINPALVEFLDQRGFFIKYSEIFYTAIDRESMIHCDGDPGEYLVPNDMAKINHIAGGRESVMNWYRPKTEKKYTTSDQPTNKYVAYDASEVELIARAKLQGWNIVQVAPPHNISNYVTRRVCTSVTIRLKSHPDHMPPYQSLVDAFV